MMKWLEIRDRGTLIPVACFDTVPDNREQQNLIRHCGYGDGYDPSNNYVVVCKINGGTGQATSDPYDWNGSRTMQTAHKYIRAEWKHLRDGDVVCVETILGERKLPKRSEVNP